MAPTSAHRRPRPRFRHLFAGARLRRTDTRISLVTTYSRCQARCGLRPRGAPVPLARARHGLLPAPGGGGANPSALTHVLFGAQYLQGRLHPLPLHLACFRAYASTRLLPAAPQGSIPGSWLAITRTGVPPARIRSLPRPHRLRNCDAAQDEASRLSGVVGERTRVPVKGSADLCRAARAPSRAAGIRHQGTSTRWSVASDSSATRVWRSSDTPFFSDSSNFSQRISPGIRTPLSVDSPLDALIKPTR